MARCEDRVIVAGVALCRADIADGAVTMIEVVQTHEGGGPCQRRVQIDEAPGGELWAELGVSEQRLREGVVVAHARARVRRLDAQPVQHRQHGSGFERGAVVAVQHRLDGQRGDALGQRRILAPQIALEFIDAAPILTTILTRGEASPDAIPPYHECFRARTIVLRHLGTGHQLGRFQNGSSYLIHSIGIGAVHVKVPVTTVNMKLCLAKFANIRMFYRAS